MNLPSRIGLGHRRLLLARPSTKSAAAMTLSAGLVIRVATSLARSTQCGSRIVRRSVTNVFAVVVEKRRAVPTFNRLTRVPHNV